MLLLLANEGRALSLAELAAQLALPKGTENRIGLQLLASGFLARDVDERSFVVGPALRQLALGLLNHGGVRGLRHEVLAELVANVGESCNFTTLDGARVPRHGTASGKLFLAQMPQAAIDALIARRSQCSARWREFRSLTRSRS